MSKKNEVKLFGKIEWKDFFDENVEVLNEHPFIVESYLEDNEGFIHFESMKKFNTKDVQVSKEPEQVHSQEKISLKEIKLKHALNWGFMQTSAKVVLKVEDIDENIMVSINEAEKIIAQCNLLNRQKANANNPNHFEDRTSQSIRGKVTMADLMAKYDVNIHTIKEIAYMLNIPEIGNEKSYTSDVNIKRIVVELLKKKKDIKSDINSCESYFERLCMDDFKIFIDTSFLMNVNILDLLEITVVPYLEKYQGVVYITDSVLYEISNKLKYPEDKDTYEKALLAQEALKRLSEKEFYQIPESGSVNKTFADAELISIFSDLRLKYNLCLLSNDYKRQKRGGLCGSIMRLSEDPNIDGIKEIEVYTLSQTKNHPELIKFHLNRDVNFNLHGKSPLRIKL